MKGVAVLADTGTAHVAFLERLAAAGAKLVEGDDPCVPAKAQKNAVELQGATDAQRRDGAAVARFLAWLDAQPLDGSLDEEGAAARLERERARDPLFRGPSFDSISAHGPNGALPHYRATPESNRKLTGDTLYLIDSGGQYLDATTDITRTVAFGTPSAEMRDRFTLVLKGMIAISLAVFPEGTTGAQIDALARQALWRHGLDFDHGTGHGVGSYLCVHEGPARISKLGTAALQPGMILSNEPGYYQQGAYGIRIENLVAVESRPTPEGGDRKLLGFRTLTLCPIDRRLIEPALLTAEERSWLDAYHARVEEELGPLVGEAAGWLKDACRPLELAPAGGLGLQAHQRRDPDLGGPHRVVEQHRHQADHEAALQDERGVVRQQPRDDDLAQALGRHGRADRGGAEIDHHRQPDALQDHRQGQRQLDAEQALALVHPHALGGIEHRWRHARRGRSACSRRSAAGRRGTGRSASASRRSRRRHGQRQHGDRREGLADIDDRARERQELGPGRAGDEDPEADRHERAGDGGQEHDQQMRARRG